MTALCEPCSGEKGYNTFPDALHKTYSNTVKLGWLVVLGFNATLTAKVISWRSVTHMCFLAFSHKYKHSFSFQNHRLLLSHASAVVRGENTPERKFASTGDRTHSHQVMSLKRSPLSHPDGAYSETPIVRITKGWHFLY